MNIHQQHAYGGLNVLLCPSSVGCQLPPTAAQLCPTCKCFTARPGSHSASVPMRCGDAPHVAHLRCLGRLRARVLLLGRRHGARHRGRLGRRGCTGTHVDGQTLYLQSAVHLAISSQQPFGAISPTSPSTTTKNTHVTGGHTGKHQRAPTSFGRRRPVGAGPAPAARRAAGVAAVQLPQLLRVGVDDCLHAHQHQQQYLPTATDHTNLPIPPSAYRHNTAPRALEV